MTRTGKAETATAMEQQLMMRFYVASNGSDQWSGKLATPNASATDGPFATLIRARDAIRDLAVGAPTDAPDPYGLFEPVRPPKRVGLKQPVQVLVRGGTYCLERTLVLGRKDSGSQECPITYAAYPGEKPVLSGGRVIRGWRPYRGDIWQCELPEAKGGKWKTRQLFYNGQRMIRARWPKYDPADPICGGWATVEEPTEENPAFEFRFQPGTFPRTWARPTEAEVNVWIGPGWTSNIIPIRSIDQKQRIITLRRRILSYDRLPWTFNITIQAGARYYVENVLEELTTPGEWCLDGEEGILYFWPPDGRLLDGEVVLPLLDCLVSIEQAAWLTVSGLTFTGTSDGDDVHRSHLDGYGAMLPQPGWKYVGEALHAKGAEHCTIAGNLFCGLGGNAVYLEGHNLRNEIVHNEFSDVGASAVSLIGNRVHHPLFNRVEDNDIHHCAVINKYGAGVFLGVSDGNVIGHNTIHDLPDRGIHLGSNTVGRNIVEYNIIRRVSMEGTDSGAINAWGDAPFWTGIDPMIERPGHIVRYNYICDVLGVRRDEQGKYVQTRNASSGLYLDDCASNFFVYGNIFVRCGNAIVIQCAKHNILENNVMVDCLNQFLLTDGVRMRPGNHVLEGFMVGNRFCRNICYSTRPNASLCVFVELGDVADHWETLLSQVDENILWKPDGSQFIVSRTDAFWAQPKDMTFTDWLHTGYDRHSIVSDPLFVDPEHEDYRMRPESPALKLGFQPIDFAQMGVRAWTT